MHKARIKGTDKFVEAEDLKVMSNVAETEFICVDENCGISLIPCSYGQDNKVRPYFKKARGVEHKSDCEYSKLLEFLKIGKKQRITDEELSMFEYPAKLVERPKEKSSKDVSTSDSLPEEKGSGNRHVMSGEFDSLLRSNKHVTSINLIIDFFISCPYNRDALLNLLGKEGEYNHMFKSISYKSHGKFEDGKIFHGVLYSSRGEDSIRDEKDFVYFRLLSCERWEDSFGGKQQVNPYWVKLNKADISKYKLDRILEDRKTVNNQSKEDYQKQKKNKSTNAMVFFLGKAPKYKDPFTFEVIDDYISFRYAQVNYP